MSTKANQDTTSTVTIKLELDASNVTEVLEKITKAVESAGAWVSGMHFPRSLTTPLQHSFDTTDGQKALTSVPAAQFNDAKTDSSSFATSTCVVDVPTPEETLHHVLVAVLPDTPTNELKARVEGLADAVSAAYAKLSGK